MTTVTTRPTDDRVATRSATASFLGRPEVGALIGAVAVAVLFFAAAPAFSHVANIGTILYGSSTIGIMAVGMTMVLIAGGLDLSVGSVLAVGAVLAARLMTYSGVNPWLAVVAANPRARAFYERAGWQDEGPFDHLVGVGNNDRARVARDAFFQTSRHERRFGDPERHSLA